MSRFTGWLSRCADTLQRMLCAGLPLALLAVATAGAQRGGEAVDRSRTAPGQFKVDSWQEEQGLPMSAVHAVHQGRDGTLWVGTGGGLARFDGLRFELVESSEVPALSKRPIFGLMEDAAGGLWIGHVGGAARWQAGRFESVFDQSLLKGRRVWSFAQASDGSVWAASENGLLHWQANGKARGYRVADGLPTDRLRAVAFDRDGVLWIGTTGSGLVAMRNGRFEALGPAQGFPDTEVRALLPDPAGGIWAATASAGLVHFAEGRLQRYTVAEGLPTNLLTSLSRDPSGALWVGTWGSGVSRLQDGRFTSLGLANGLGGEQIWAVHADREGSVWVGSWNGGLNRLRQRAFAVLGKPEGLLGDNTRSVLVARDGALWVSSAGGGVNRVHEGRIEAITKNEGSDGAIWMGSYTHGLARWRQGRIDRFSLEEGLPHAEVRVIFTDHSGTLWVGTRTGLARFDGRRFQLVSEPGAPKEGVVAILQDRQGTLWFGTAGEGLMRWRDGRFTTLTRKEGMASNWVLALHEDSDGTLWVGTSGEGLNRLRGDRIQSIRVSDGLWDGLAQTFQEDRQGRLWMSSNRGIFYVKRAELDAFAEGRAAKVQSVGYGIGGTLRSTTFAGGLQPTSAVDAEGRLWLASLKGLVQVDPMRLPAVSEPPALRIDAVRLAGQPLPSTGSVELPPGAVLPLSIRYAAATVLHAERLRFRYLMEGLTPNWVEVGSSREATFTVLPPGSYQFRVASTLDGMHWRESDPLPITVQAELYQKRSFQLAAGLLALLTVVGAFRWRTRLMRQRTADMERLVAEKTEALRLANEHLQRLSFSDALTGLANRRRFDAQLDTEWRRMARERTPLALLLADVDFFKAYNDNLGHGAGDACLVSVAEVVRHTASRASDLAARYGGEEFVLLIPGLDAAGALAYAERLRLACEARALPHPASSVAPVVTLSVGVACCIPDHDTEPSSLFAAADAALYRAKQGGRNRVA
jgi:diguanylate cyclase (GGDEF)-like protein